MFCICLCDCTSADYREILLPILMLWRKPCHALVSFLLTVAAGCHWQTASSGVSSALCAASSSSTSSFSSSPSGSSPRSSPASTQTSPHLTKLRLSQWQLLPSCVYWVWCGCLGPFCLKRASVQQWQHTSLLSSIACREHWFLSCTACCLNRLERSMPISSPVSAHHRRRDTPTSAVPILPVVSHEVLRVDSTPENPKYEELNLLFYPKDRLSHFSKSGTGKSWF